MDRPLDQYRLTPSHLEYPVDPARPSGREIRRQARFLGDHYPYHTEVLVS